MNWDYIAGIFDGEGCLFVRKNYPKTQPCRLYMKITITNRNLECLEKIKEFLGYKGKMIYYIKASKPRRKCYFLYFTHRKNCFHFLTHIKDKAIVKRDQIFKALKLLEEYHNLK